MQLNTLGEMIPISLQPGFYEHVIGAKSGIVTYYVTLGTAAGADTNVTIVASPVVNEKPGVPTDVQILSGRSTVTFDIDVSKITSAGTVLVAVLVGKLSATATLEIVK